MLVSLVQVMENAMKVSWNAVMVIESMEGYVSKME